MVTLYALVLFYLLLVKHAIADFALQSFRKPGDKTNFRDPKGYIHAADHSILTFFVVLLLTFDPVDSIIIAVVDFVLHYWIDFIKTLVVKKTKLTTQDRNFWIVQACDQILHYACYLGYTIFLI